MKTFSRKEVKEMIAKIRDFRLSWEVKHYTETIKNMLITYLDMLEPVPMILYCPMCGSQHIDPPDFRPHRSHRCEFCKCIWRPADVETRGVDRITTVGGVDTWVPGTAAHVGTSQPIGPAINTFSQRNANRMADWLDAFAQALRAGARVKSGGLAFTDRLHIVGDLELHPVLSGRKPTCVVIDDDGYIRGCVPPEQEEIDTLRKILPPNDIPRWQGASAGWSNRTELPAQELRALKNLDAIIWREAEAMYAEFILSTEDVSRRYFRAWTDLDLADRLLWRNSAASAHK